ncbi:MAG: hypothetical protein AB1638_12280 [Nitrospirota bacterium]
MEENKLLLGLDLSLASREAIELLIEYASEPSIFGEIVRANFKRPEVLRILFENPDTPEEVRELAAQGLNISLKPLTISESPRRQSESPQNLLQRVQRLSVAEKIRLALRCNKEVRSALIKDPNKEVVLTVLENPKITETEIEMIATIRSIPEEALRKIAKKREWIKNYAIVFALVKNPKTPAGIAIGFLNGLKTKDLSILENNKNVAEAVRIMAKKILQSRKMY